MSVTLVLTCLWHWY